MDKSTDIGRIITSPECVSEGAQWLSIHEPRFGKIYELCAPLPTRLRAAGYDELFRAIVSQQLSVAAAATIWARLEKADLIAPSKILNADDDAVRRCGLSGQKLRYARALASSNIDYNALEKLPNDDVIRVLTAVPGIGVWSAEIYAIFSLGRADAFAAGDLALQASARLLFELSERPSEKTLRQMATDWQPWRSVAARMLWAYYRHQKNRGNVT